jgi:hypothetical protein
MSEHAYLQLPLSDDVVRFVFAKLDFADVTLYASHHRSGNNFQ